MRYFEAPQEYTTGQKAVFLAGGITDCPDWQQEVVKTLGHMAVDLLNPRRANFPIHDPSAAEAQIKWEFEHLRRADAILFWFCKETMCPIVLYELGCHSVLVDSRTGLPKTIFVGVEPNYPREQDVLIQTRLTRPAVRVVHSINALCAQVSAWLVPGSYAR